MGAGKGTAPRPLGGRGPLYLSDSLTALLLTLGGFFAFLSACGAVWPAWMPAAVGAMALAAVLVWSLPRGAYLAAGGHSGTGRSGRLAAVGAAGPHSGGPLERDGGGSGGFGDPDPNR